MTFARPIFSSLFEASHARLRRLPVPSSWCAEPALSGFVRVADVLVAAQDAPAPSRRRAVLGALLRLAPPDNLAAEVLLAALVPALRAVSVQLSRRSPAEPADVDALVLSGAWQAICGFGGTEQPWPDRVVVHRARDIARTALRREVSWRWRESLVPEPDRELGAPADEAFGVFVVGDVLRRAVAKERITTGGAQLVWRAHVEGWTSVELATLLGRGAAAVSMERLRAERALRSAVA